MKKTYKLGAHVVKLVLKKKFKDPNQCGEAKWESKVVELRPTNVDDGTVYRLPGFLANFFHEFFHMVDTMQGTDLFSDRDEAENYIKENLLDSFCEGFVGFGLANKIFDQGWLEGVKEMLEKERSKNG